MITKRHVKSRNVTKVTFELADQNAENIALIADFTDWQPLELSRLKSGKWKLERELEPGRSYEFRYLLKQGEATWFANDEAADRFVLNPHGSENAVLEC